MRWHFCGVKINPKLIVQSATEKSPWTGWCRIWCPRKACGVYELMTPPPYEADSTSFDRDMSGRFINHPRTRYSRARRGCFVPTVSGCVYGKGRAAFSACAWLRGALTEAGKAPRVQSDWPILLVIACRSQSRLVGKLIRSWVCDLCDPTRGLRTHRVGNSCVTATSCKRFKDLSDGANRALYEHWLYARLSTIVNDHESRNEISRCF